MVGNSSDSDSSDSESSDSDSDSGNSGADPGETSESNRVETGNAGADDGTNATNNVVDVTNLNETTADNAETTHNESSGAMENENSLYSSFQETDFDVALSEVATVSSPNIGTMGTRSANSLYAMMAAASEDTDEPKTFRQALESSEQQQWKQAMLVELNLLKENDTWEICDLPNGRKAIDCKWVYKVKRNVTGAIERYKARLVIKGYSQIQGIDYDETYSPVARYTSIRFLLAMAARYNMHIHQMDAVTAFLQGELTEEIYMRQPEGLNIGLGKVCRLKRALYGLKQSSRVWNDKLNSVLVSKMKFVRSTIDTCVYYRHSAENTIILAVWVDDITIFASNSTMCTKLKMSWLRTFE